MKKIKVLDIPFDICTKHEVLERCVNYIRAPYAGGVQVVTPNPEMLLEAQKNPPFKKVLQEAWLSIPDGIGILWAATFQSAAQNQSEVARFFKALTSLASLIFNPSSAQKIFPQRVSGVDVMQGLCAISGKLHFSIFLLGAAPGVAEKAQHVLQKKYHDARIVGTQSGSPSDDDFSSIHAHIAETQPDVLCVALGAPAQELWIKKHLPEFTSVKIAIGVGGTFDFIAGVRKRAPEWMQKSGLEWLYRLIQQPSRIKRIFNATIRFPLTVIRKIN